MSDYTHWFRETTPYISAHRGKTFVVSLPGEALASSNLTNIVHDLALLNVIGVRLVIVHGARPQLDAALGPVALDALSLDAEDKDKSQWRVTSEADLPTLTAEIAKLRARLESIFSAGLPGSPLHNTAINLVSGNFVLAKPVGIRDGVNYQFTGQVRSLKIAAINKALDMGSIVLLSPQGFSPAGQMYNLPAEELAAETAVGLGADKLITFAEEAFIKDVVGRDLPELTPGDLESLLAQLPKNASSRRRLSAMLSACRRGVPRAPQVSYAIDGALLAELFTADGHGSQLSEKPYRNVREAVPGDLSDIVALIRPLEQEGLLVRRSRAQIERDIKNFLVAEVDSTVVGCCALHFFAPVETQAGALELACFASSPTQAHSRVPVGDQLLAAAEQRALDLNAQTLFVLTIAAQDWFVERGFKAASIAELPDAKKASYDQERASHALVKHIHKKQSSS